MATAGVSAKLDKTLAKYPIKTGQNSAFSDKVIKSIGEGVSRGVLENVVYGTNLEDALVKNLKGQLTNAATAAAFSDFVKHIVDDSCQNAGKGSNRIRGHIFVDEVPATRR